MKENSNVERQALEKHIHYLCIHDDLLQYRLDGAKEALTDNETMKDKQRVLPLMAHDIEWQGAAKWWSPSSKDGDAQRDAQQRYEKELEAAKVTWGLLQCTQEFLKEKEKEDGHKRREREKKERDRPKAGKAKEVAERKKERVCHQQDCNTQTLYKCTSPASARPHRKQHQERRKIVVLWLRGVVLSAAQPP